MPRRSTIRIDTSGTSAKSRKSTRGKDRGKQYRTSKRGFVRYKKALSLKQHQFCERALGDIIGIGNEAGQGAAPFWSKSFKFADIPQCDSYSNIFEQYRLDKIVVTFRYKGIAVPATQIAGTTTMNMGVNELNPLLYFKVDHNDINADTLVKMKVSTRTKTHKFTNDKPEFSISLKPASQELLIRQLTPTVTSTNVPAWKKWIDADGIAGPGSSVEHFGLKCYCVGYADLNFKPGTLDVSYKYYFSMKSNE